ncbi:MAG: 6-phosphofructokinase [Candidatus Marinimicrobia bacterium]|nr:6-phosphofructokinase [Candidatus Neomarinimicrobiota bacterium]
MRIGILTGGGDCPGLNAAIRAVVRRSIDVHGHEVYGIRDGWKGLVEGDVYQLSSSDMAGLIREGGTILGTSRTNPYNEEEDLKSLKENIKKFKFDAIVAIGGDDTLLVATKLTEDGIPCVGIPKTIDNDLSATDATFGFDTALTIAVEAIDRLTTTAKSHHRTIVVEVMGRQAGWIALHAGIAGSAHCIMLPEFKMSVSEVVSLINKRKEAGKRFHIIVVSEGAAIGGDDSMVTQDESLDDFGNIRLGGVGKYVGKEIGKQTGDEIRTVVLGHTQRGGSPTAYDRMLATRFGLAAADYVNNGDFGKMAALKGNEIVPVPLSDATSELKLVPAELYELAKTFFS